MKFEVVEYHKDFSITLRDGNGQDHFIPTDCKQVRIFDYEDFAKWLKGRDFKIAAPTKKWLQTTIEYYNFDHGAIGLYGDGRQLIYSDSKVEYNAPNVNVAEVRVEPATAFHGIVLYRIEGEQSWQPAPCINRNIACLRVVRKHMYEGE